MKQELNTISFNITDGIGHLELNRPPGNQMNTAFFADFNELADGLKNIHGLKAIIISSQGRHFSSGANLDELLELAAADGNGLQDERTGNWVTNSEKNCRSFLLLEELDIPVIAAIRGVCIGSAFELALYSHFRFCAEDAVLGLPESTFNLMPGLGGIRKVAVLSGEAKAIELVLKGNTFDPEEALQHHLIDRIVSRRQVVEFSFAFARKVMWNYNKAKKTLYLQQIQSDAALLS